MQTDRNVLDRILLQYGSFSKNNKRIADYIVANKDKAVYLTARKLGAAVGVSSSSAVRFASVLGYESYADMQAELQKLTKSTLTSVQRLELMSAHISGDDVLSTVLHNDIHQIRQTLEFIDNDAFIATVDAIVAAKRVYVAGERSAHMLAGFLSYYFGIILESVTQVHASSTTDVLEQILRIGDGDCLIAVSFPRYSHKTVQAVHYAKQCGATTVAITDSDTSPISQSADYKLIAVTDVTLIADSLVAPLSVINALIAAVGMRRGKVLADTLGKLEQVWDEYAVYEKT